MSTNDLHVPVPLAKEMAGVGVKGRETGRVNGGTLSPSRLLEEDSWKKLVG